MTGFRNFARIGLMALLGTSFGLDGFAQTGPRVVGSGENAEVVYDAPSPHIVGGARVRVIGNGENTEIVTLEVYAAQSGGNARVTGSGENMTIVYDSTPTTLFTSARRRD